MADLALLPEQVPPSRDVGRVAAKRIDLSRIAAGTLLCSSQVATDTSAAGGSRRALDRPGMTERQAARRQSDDTRQNDDECNRDAMTAEHQASANSVMRALPKMASLLSGQIVAKFSRPFLRQI